MTNNHELLNLNGLNDKQKEAVLITDGPLLIVAGAGAGKTKTMTHRILHLIKNGLPANKILAITFTNKASAEMRNRLKQLIEEDAMVNRPVSMETFPFVSTFHSLGVYIIKEESNRLGLPRFFSIFDRNDSKSAIKKAIVSCGFDPKSLDPSKVLSIISREKGEAKTVEEYELEEGNNYMHGVVTEVWKAYEKILFEEKALDFDDLLLKTLWLLKNNEIATKYQNIWSHIHIDEYQDTNKVQYDISKILAGENKNIAVVGDIDQSIYSWRGADYKNIMRFEEDFPNTSVILLEENYRSTKTIIDVANSIIEKNEFRKKKTLYTKNQEGDLISLYVAVDEKDEADKLAKTIEMLLRQNVEAQEIAVLYRANFQSRTIEEAFIKRRIPYDIIGTKFFERKEIKDTLSYLRLSLNNASFSDLKRAISFPSRGIGKVTLAKIAEKKEDDLRGIQREKFDSFKNLIASIKIKALSERVSKTIKYIISASGMEDTLRKGSEEELERLENLKELVSIAISFDEMPPEEGIAKFLEHASLASDQDEITENKKGVRLMTVHASKGLEFDYCFISGLEAKLFPHEREDEKRNPKESAEEERRLFYVALTRARKKLYLSYASSRMIYGSREFRIPSEFLGDIDENKIIRENGGGREKIIYLDI